MVRAFFHRPQVLSLLAGAFLVPGAFLIHLHLTCSFPARDAVLREAPKEVRLTFSARPELGFSDISLLGRGGAAVELGEVVRTSDSLTIAAPIEGAVPDGPLTVVWRTAGKDGHVLRGRYDFEVSRP